MSWNRSNSTKKNKVVYNIININDTTKDKECIAADKKNEKKYRETIEKTRNSTKLWENTGVTINLDVPVPPKPNNYERLLEFRKKNVLRPAIKQSEATIYLYEKNYVLGRDYEAYQAMDIVDKLKKYDLNENFDSDFCEESNDENIIRANKKSLNLNNNFFRRRNSVNLEEGGENNMDLNIFDIAPNLENRRRSMNLYQNDSKVSRSISLPSQNFTNNTIYESDDENYNGFMRKRSNSEMKINPNYNIEKKIDNRINSRINNFQNLGDINKTEKEDLLPKQELYPNLNNSKSNMNRPSAPFIPSNSKNASAPPAPSAPSAPFTPRKNIYSSYENPKALSPCYDC